MKSKFEIDESKGVATGDAEVRLNSSLCVGKRDAYGCLLLDDEIDTWMTVYTPEEGIDYEDRT